MPDQRKKILRGEFVRKLLHISGVFCVPLATFSRRLTVLLLFFAVIFYLIMELCRLQGRRSHLLGSIILLASRGNEKDGIVLGPITLAFGIILVLVFFPLFPAQVGIVALTIGDGVSSLVGRLWGRIRPKLFLGKSLEGSLSCLVATFYVLLLLGLSTPRAFLLALATMLIELLPLGSFDNVMIPISISTLTFVLGVLPYTQRYFLT